MDDKIESDKKSKDKTYQVYENKGQLKVTIPRVLAQAIGIKKDDKVKWIVDKGYLILEKVK